MVVLYEWWEKPTDKRILEAALEALSADPSPSSHGSSSAVPAQKQPQDAGAILSRERRSLGRLGTTVTVVRGSAVEEKGSRFLAVLAFPIATQAHGHAALALLRQDGALAGATHRVACFRAEDGTEVMDDDGEARAGAQPLTQRAWVRSPSHHRARLRREQPSVSAQAGQGTGVCPAGSVWGRWKERTPI